MLLLIFTLIVAVAGIAAIEFAQPTRPRDVAHWSDETERRLLRGAGSRNAW